MMNLELHPQGTGYDTADLSMVSHAQVQRGENVGFAVLWLWISKRSSCSSSLPTVRVKPLPSQCHRKYSSMYNY